MVDRPSTPPATPTETAIGVHRVGPQAWLIGAVLAAISAGGWAWMFHSSLDHHGEPVRIFLHDMAMDHATAVVPPRAYAAASVPMWFFMLMAMTAPAAIPMASAHARHARETGEPALTTWLFVLAYLAVWSLFAVVAAVVQMVLVETGIMLRTSLMLGNDRLAGLLLMVAGVYQMTPVKFRCVEHCRHPASFLARFWRPGPSEALALGFRHAAYCVGCSWLLMSLLFVGGAMNLAWAISLTVLVLIEKVVPYGRQIGLVAGVICLLTGVGLAFRFFGT